MSYRLSKPATELAKELSNYVQAFQLQHGYSIQNETLASILSDVLGERLRDELMAKFGDYNMDELLKLGEILEARINKEQDDMIFVAETTPAKKPKTKNKKSVQ